MSTKIKAQTIGLKDGVVIFNFTEEVDRNMLSAMFKRYKSEHRPDEMYAKLPNSWHQITVLYDIKCREVRKVSKKPVDELPKIIQMMELTGAI